MLIAVHSFFLNLNIVHIVGYSASVCECKHGTRIIPLCDSQNHTLLFCSLYDNAHRKDVLIVQPVSYQPPIVCWVSSTRMSHCRGECFLKGDGFREESGGCRSRDGGTPGKT